jgi:inorganic pyrophosphatase
LSEIQHFFQVYKDLEGKRVEIGAWEKSEAAMHELMDSIARYEAVYSKLGGR